MERGSIPMAQNVPVIGLHPDELQWIRMLVALLRHPDPTIPELARQALVYLSRGTSQAATY
ncbi:MAG: hypothetical protein C5B51_22905 [Terriglobia bacterium]|nr:MAG: hypothetical protein C5B51_22905 [Terriglobia bacterium]